MRNKRERTKQKLIAAVILIAAVFGLTWVIRPTFVDDKSSVEQVLDIPKIRRAIDGVLVESGQENPPIAGIMIENMIEAQPLSGIADARLVFEAVTEANITRFLAYFVIGGDPISDASEIGSQDIIEIGPVRSARPYYLNFATPFNTVFAHVGSSPAAYNLLRKEGVMGINDLDQWYKSEYFFSKQGRSKPHHMYTTTELLKRAHGDPISEESEIGSLYIKPWLFKSDASPDLRGNVNDIRINYITPYNAQWLYDKSENYYKRMQWGTLSVPNTHAQRGGGVHKDAQGKEIIANNIAVAFMKMKVLDDVGRKEFTTIGEGKGLVFQDGRVVVGTWKREKASDMLRWYDSQGNEVEFNAGITWVEIVPEGYKVEY